MDRRTLLHAAWLAALPRARRPQQDSSAVARLWQPELAGRSRDRVTDYENDPFVVGVEKRLRCTCGCNLDIYTCRTTDFTCTYSPALHREVVALVEEHKTAEEILAAFVEQHGESILMAPPKEGFNWAGYLLPGVVITLTGTALAWALMRRARVGPAPAVVGPEVETGLSPEDAARLAAELESVDS